jgi:hypothetical protein
LAYKKSSYGLNLSNSKDKPLEEELAIAGSGKLNYHTSNFHLSSEESSVDKE